MDQLNYYINLSCDYSEAVYQEAMSKRYGIKFCCEKNLQELELEYEKFKLNSEINNNDFNIF